MRKTKALIDKPEQEVLPHLFREAAPSAPLGLKQALAEMEAVKKAAKLKDNALRIKYRAEIENAGFRIIRVKKDAEAPPIEADYGAPALGLSLFKKIFNLRSAFRYTPVEYVGQDPYTYANAAIDIGRTLLEQGYTLFENAKEKDYKSLIHFTNGGVTKAFNDTISTIIDEFEAIQKIRKTIAREQRGIILVPMPTYGLFLDSIDRITAGKNIKIVPVKRRDNGSVDMLSLETQINVCEMNGDRILAYFDNSPLNPTGYIRTRAETFDAASVIAKASNKQLEKEMAFYLSKTKKLDSKGGPKALNDILFYYVETPLSSITIIDDMAYEGLEMNARRKPFSFGQCGEETAKATVVLKGISKIGMPGLRIGMLIGHPHIAAYLTKHQVTKEFSANSMGVDVMATRYGTGPQRNMFKRHEKKLRENHLLAAKRVQAFFKGLDNVPELTARERLDLVFYYAVHHRIPMDVSERMLKEGLPNFQIAGIPESGFFQCVNCEALKDRTLALEMPGYMPEEYTLGNGDTLYWAFRAFEIKVVTGNAMGLSNDSFLARISFSLPEKDMFTLYDRLRDMHEYFWGKNPQVQLDIFRHHVKETPFPR